MLEVALKRSIDWSMRNRRPSVTPLPGEGFETIAAMNSKLSDESHMRAFISHFKIELNSLMGSKWLEREQAGIAKYEVVSASDENDSIDTDAGIESTGANQLHLLSRSSAMIRVPRIKIDGKHSGQYDLNEPSDAEEDVGQPDRCPIIDKCSNGKRVSRSSRRRDAAKHVNGHRAKSQDPSEDFARANYEDDTDAGYGSLGRDGFRSNLVQQLNDIKSRLIDMVHEIDESVRSLLTEDELEAFKKRRDALIAKLDDLIDISTQKVAESPRIVVSVDADDLSDPSSSTASNSLQYSTPLCPPLIKNKSELNLHSNGYEEQVHVIDYNMRRRASDNSALKSSYLYNQPLVRNSSMTRINVSAGFDRSKPIDFGAMMRDYENERDMKPNGHSINEGDTNRKAQQIISNNTQHIPSSSSTSTYSASSHTSSSSFL